ncbi:MAG: GTP-binding protein [Alphaproteobacteria bacterium TMED89]|nr:hypothetical protein [Rhodospirillaceae bacterium]RPH10708.1 MAG: GTP-binding protein [Alphaproteobacteria bacterium TMED89]
MNPANPPASSDTAPTASPLPITVIGGYLGAGKTTLVNHLLRNAQGRRLAVLVNEFGSIAIDEDLIEAEEDGLISIAGGCICCSFGNDLIGAIEDLRAVKPAPDHIIVETSGVALPGAVVASLALMDHIRPDGIVVLVDGETVIKQSRDDYIGDTITRQLLDAEIVVINKRDLISDSTAATLTSALTDLAPSAVQIEASFGTVPLNAVLGAVAVPAQGSVASGGHSDGLFESIAFTPDHPHDVPALAEQLATGPLGVVRAKGYIAGKDGDIWLLQTVGKRWQAERLDHHPTTQLVCIGPKGQLATDEIRSLVQPTL